jgi:AcrR family transcriptional regulator
MAGIDSRNLLGSGKTRRTHATLESSAGIVLPLRAVRRRRTRAERARDVREAIFRAAARIVGEYGYADSSVNRITELAGIAQGTFYLYFDSRQALFEELLAHEGQDLVLAMRHAVRGATSFYEVEEQGYRAFFEYMREHPWMFRVLNEAEVAAPAAHSRYLSMMIGYYIASLKRSVAAGEIRRYAEAELEALAHMLIAARTSVYRRYVKSARCPARTVELAVGTYMKLVRGGIN